MEDRNVSDNNIQYRILITGQSHEILHHQAVRAMQICMVLKLISWSLSDYLRCWKSYKSFLILFSDHM